MMEETVELDLKIREIVSDDEAFLRFGMNFAYSKEPKVYFVRCNEYVKIGTCRSNLSIRITELQVGNPYSLEIEGFIPANRDTEQRLHKELDKFWHRGEWFKLTPLQVKTIISNVLKNNWD